MFCAKCGASIPDAAANCPQCGASTAAPPPSAPQASPYATASAPASQPQGYSGPQQTDGKAVASLVLGIMSIFLCLSFIAGIPAVILGHISKSNIRKSMGRLKGDGMATAGLIMGYISFTVMIPVILIILAIAIPNLMRSRMAANESAAASTVRTVNVAQMTYITTYPDKGYAVDLASLGPGSEGSCSTPGYPSAAHACLLDDVLAGPSCTDRSWCTKYGYRFNSAAICGNDGVCSNFVVSATPVTPGTTGQKSFCSTSDAVVRSNGGRGRGTVGAIVTPLTVEECNSWPPIS